MDKKLPGVFANRIDKKLDNNTRVSVTKDDEKEVVIKKTKSSTKNIKNINQKISEIFSSTRYVYKADVVITLKDKTIIKRIVGKNNNNLITIDNELIPINDIIDIEYQN